MNACKIWVALCMWWNECGWLRCKWKVWWYKIGERYNTCMLQHVSSNEYVKALLKAFSYCRQLEAPSEIPIFQCVFLFALKGFTLLFTSTLCSCKTLTYSTSSTWWSPRSLVEITHTSCSKMVNRLLAWSFFLILCLVCLKMSEQSRKNSDSYIPIAIVLFLATPSSWLWMFCSPKMDKRALVAAGLQPAIFHMHEMINSGVGRGRGITWQVFSRHIKPCKLPSKVDCRDRD